MNIKTIMVTYGRKVNLGNYETANLEVSMTAEIEPDEGHSKALGVLWSQAMAEVSNKMIDLKRLKGQPV